MGDDTNKRGEWTRAVVTVWRGRGFVVGTDEKRFIITASHCLPRLPLRHPAAHTTNQTYAKLLGRLGEKATVSAECLLIDLVADLAVLGEPDRRLFSDQSAAYLDLVKTAVPLPIADLPLGRPQINMREGGIIYLNGPPEARCTAWVPSLKRRWFRCDVRATSRVLFMTHATDKITGGMSGSPIVSDDGKAIGVVVVNLGIGGGRSPFLSRNLPAWLLDEVALRRDL